MTKQLYSTFSIFLSALCILIISGVNIKIANRYLSSDGKTQALFVIVETLCFSYKYWFIGLSIGSIITSILGKRKDEETIFWDFFDFRSYFTDNYIYSDLETNDMINKQLQQNKS